MGTAIEAPDPAALARYYSELLRWTIGHEEPGTTILAAPEGSVYVVFQQTTGYQAPVWPPLDGQQRPMMHFEFQVGDLESAVAEARPRSPGFYSHRAGLTRPHACRCAKTWPASFARRASNAAGSLGFLVPTGSLGNSCLTMTIRLPVSA